MNSQLKIGTIVQAYGFPMISGFKGENFYKVVDIKDGKAFFRRCNELGDVGNLALGTFSADIKTVNDAIQSVEGGISTNGLKIWKESILREFITTDKTDATLKVLKNKLSKEYPSIEAVNVISGTPKEFAVIFTSKPDADKFSKKWPAQSKGKYKFEKTSVESYGGEKYYYVKFMETKKTTSEASLKEARGVSTVQKEYSKILSQIESTLESYKKVKGTPAATEFVTKLKELNVVKKKLESELDAKVSGLYKDAELKAESVLRKMIKRLVSEQLTKEGVEHNRPRNINESGAEPSNYLMLLLPALSPILLALVKNSIKSWWAKNKANKTIQQIMNRLKDDPEIIAFQKNPTRYDWERLLRKKLGRVEAEKLHRLYQTIEKNS